MSAAEGTVVAFGVEGTGSYGIGLARFLRRQGCDRPRGAPPPRKGERRLSGRSDTIDAEHAARQVLSGRRHPVPKTATGAIEALRLIKVARETAVKARTSAIRLVASGEGLLSPAVTRRVMAAAARCLPRAADPNRLADLTARELDVLTEVAAGRTNGEVAARLHIGPATARTHVGRLLAKRQARDRAQLVVLAYETGHVTPG